MAAWLILYTKTENQPKEEHAVVFMYLSIIIMRIQSDSTMKLL